MSLTAVVNQSISIPFTLFDSLGAAETGKGNADFTKSAYLVSTPATTASPTVTENASGTYRIAFTPTAVGVWHCTWSVSVDGETVPYEETVQVVTASQDDPVAYLTGVVTVTTPVASDNSVTVYQSDHYDDDESRSLEWSTTSADTWPTLTSASIAFVARHTTQTHKTLSVAGSVVTGTGTNKEVRVELTPTDTNGKPAGSYDYQVIATLSNSHVVTLVAGSLTLTERIRS